ncbi:MAG: hypothetical protein J6Q94_04830 [Clostridia bacterium]|nr:hypothetical protein [Clostridia bacterium]
MKKIIAAICAVVLLITSVSVSAFALTKEDADSAVVAQKELFESVFGRNITAGDARDVLLTSAGLKTDNANNDLFDIDEDGKITAIDARIHLRIAAKLDNLNNYYNDVKYDYFCAIINSVKPSGSKFYESVAEEIEKVDYVDYNDVVGQMNKQLDLYSSYDESMKGYDFAKELRASEGDKTFSYRMANTQIITENNYPVKENELSCFATLDDIEKVEYKTNQSFTFTRLRKQVGSDEYKTAYEETVTGLDSITVYIKSENVSLTGNTNGIFDNLKTGKAFDILSEEDLEELIETNSSIGAIEGMEDLGKCDISITPKSLNYKGCYITVYFDPETGVPMGSVHNLHYVMSMTMKMDIDISAKSLAGDDALIQALITLLTLQNGGKLLKVNGSMDISNEMNTRTVTYFTSNNADHQQY